MLILIIFWAFISWVNTNHALLRAPLVDWWLPTTFSKSVIRTSLFKCGDICINPRIPQTEACTPPLQVPTASSPSYLPSFSFDSVDGNFLRVFIPTDNSDASTFLQTSSHPALFWLNTKCKSFKTVSWPPSRSLRWANKGVKDPGKASWATRSLLREARRSLENRRRGQVFVPFNVFSTIQLGPEFSSDVAGDGPSLPVKAALKFIQLNANGLSLDRVMELNQLLVTHKPDVVLLQETKLEENDATPIFKGYHAERADRTLPRQGEGKKPRGGGLLTLFRCTEEAVSRFQIQKLEPTSKASNSLAETLQVKVLWNRKFMVITNIYVPPLCPSNVQESRIDDFKAEVCLQRCLDVDTTIGHIMGGDLNGHHESWETSTSSTRNNPRGTDIFDYVVESGLLSIANIGSVNTFMRGGLTLSRSTPDLTLFSPNICCMEWCVLPAISSDHCPICFYVKHDADGEEVRPRTTQRVTKFSFKRATPEHWLAFNKKLGILLRTIQPGVL